MVRPPPSIDRDKDNAQAMALADSINAEDRAKRLPSAAEMLTVSSKGGEFRVIQKPIPAGLTKEEQTALYKETPQGKGERFMNERRLLPPERRALKIEVQSDDTLILLAGFHECGGCIDWT